MIELGVFHNGASDLPPVRASNGRFVNDGSLNEVHKSAQRVLIDQVRQGILAERLGFNSFMLTEHHFEVEGAEYSPNPLLLQTAVAARTRRIRLIRAVNILPWWHPIRIAEQAAMLDVISGGRLDFGIGRGFQPRETEVFGWPYGSSIQDQERNRAYFEEALEIILKAWTEPSFSYTGQFYRIPPTFTRWNHPSTIGYFSLPQAGRELGDILKMGPPDPTGPNPVLQSSTVLREISVLPQPIQKPYPQIWTPCISERAIRWAASRGINGYFNHEPMGRLKQKCEIYHEEAERCGWPDRLGRRGFKFGWDAQHRRGTAVIRLIHLLLPGQDRDSERKRYLRALAQYWDFIGAFGFAPLLADIDEAPYPADARIEPDLFLQKEIAIFGTPAEAAEAIMRVKDKCGYDDFFFVAWFESAGYRGPEIEAQMQCFAEEVTPTIARACGGQVQNPVCGDDLP